MPFETLARLTAAATADPGHEVITFNWHGGEPTVLPVRFYEKALLLQRRLRRSGQRIINTVQTNATLLTTDWLDFLATNRFAIGVSIDGPASVHDALRVDVRGHGTFHRVRQGLAMLRDHGVPFAVIMVVDQATIDLGPQALVDFLIEEELNDVALNFVMPAPKGPQLAGSRHYVEPARVSQFLRGVWDARALRRAEIRIRELDALERSLAGDYPGPCTLSGACLGLVYRIEPNGDVFHCDYFGIDPAYRWGNIGDSTFADLRRSPRLAQARHREHASRRQLNLCPEYAICHGWCPHVRLTAERHDPDHRADCCGLSDLIGHIRGHPRIRAQKDLPTDPRISSLLETV